MSFIRRLRALEGDAARERSEALNALAICIRDAGVPEEIEAFRRVLGDTSPDLAQSTPEDLALADALYERVPVEVRERVALCVVPGSHLSRSKRSRTGGDAGTI